MPRPKGEAAGKLLRAARALARENGCGGLSVRAVCRRAGVNLGLFHYHFKSRKAFMARVLEDTYADFFDRLSLSAGGRGTAADRLRRALATIARFWRENRRIFICLLRDALDGDAQVAKFVAAHFPRHIPIIVGLVREGQAAGEFRRMPDALALAFIMGGVSSPNLFVSLLELHTRNPFGRPFHELEDMMLSDAAIDTRIDMLLTGLAPRRRR
jgi:AcrR family transcriptional regulator